MTKTKTMKRALIMSVVSLFLCFTMLFGTTYAWFTASVAGSDNKIEAGTLDVQVLMYDSLGQEYVDISGPGAPIFGEAGLARNDTKTLWEPGKTQVIYLAIHNEGSLDLKYKVNVNVTEDPDNLCAVMKYAVTPDAKDVEGERVAAWDANASAAVVFGSNATEATTVVLKSGETHYFALSIHMDEDAGDEYQGKAMSFDIVVYATQLASEVDNFGSDDDAEAPCDTTASN